MNKTQAHLNSFIVHSKKFKVKHGHFIYYYESGKLITNIIELNWSYGLGIRYNTIVGPIRVDWAMRTDIPLSWKNAVWQVSLGEAF